MARKWRGIEGVVCGAGVERDRSGVTKWRRMRKWRGWSVVTKWKGWWEWSVVSEWRTGRVEFGEGVERKVGM